MSSPGRGRLAFYPLSGMFGEHTQVAKQQMGSSNLKNWCHPGLCGFSTEPTPVPTYVLFALWLWSIFNFKNHTLAVLSFLGFALEISSSLSSPDVHLLLLEVVRLLPLLLPSLWVGEAPMGPECTNSQFLLLSVFFFLLNNMNAAPGFCLLFPAF